MRLSAPFEQSTDCKLGEIGSRTSPFLMQSSLGPTEHTLGEHSRTVDKYTPHNSNIENNDPVKISNFDVSKDMMDETGFTTSPASGLYNESAP